MSRSRSRTSQALVAVGLVASVCAAVGTYLYFSINTASVPALRRRRKIMVSSSSAQDLLDFLPIDASDRDEIYVTLLSENDDNSPLIDEIRAQSSYLVKHEKSAGLVHIARHISPDVVILLPDIAAEIAVKEVKDWVGRVIVMDESLKAAADNKVQVVSTKSSYDHLVKL